jgi:hypothetical protein
MRHELPRASLILAIAYGQVIPTLFPHSPLQQYRFQLQSVELRIPALHYGYSKFKSRPGEWDVS